MTTTEQITLADFIKTHGITMTSTRTDHNPHMHSDNPMDHWLCTIRAGGKEMTSFVFSKGMGHKGAEPELAEVLSCLASDASSVESDDFEDWCGEMGYDTDSRKAERIYKACKAEAVKLEEFLGRDAFQTLCWHTERERLIAKCCGIEYDERHQLEPWRKQVARDLNWILSRAEYCLTTDGDASDVAFARAVLRIVARVAEFEGIRRAGK